MSNRREVTCPKCAKPLGLTPGMSGEKVSCGCGLSVNAWTFPAIAEDFQAASLPEVALLDEATCFFHSNARATVACEHCGRYVCSLCDIDLNGTHLCFTCVEAGVTQGKVKYLDRTRFLWGRTALFLAAVPPLLAGVGAFLLVPLTAPVAMFLAIYGWKKPGDLIRNSRVPHVLAIGLAVLELVAMIVGGWYFVRGITQMK